MSSRPWPEELRLDLKDSVLAIGFDTGEKFRLDAEFLRVHSPSAEVKGHGAGDARLVSGKRAVKITDMKPIGNYAVRLIFDDGHDTGLFSWDYLYKLCRDHDRLWADYLAHLDERGASREAG